MINPEQTLNLILVPVTLTYKKICIRNLLLRHWVCVVVLHLRAHAALEPTTPVSVLTLLSVLTLQPVSIRKPDLTSSLNTSSHSLITFSLGGHSSINGFRRSQGYYKVGNRMVGIVYLVCCLLLRDITGARNLGVY